MADVYPIKANITRHGSAEGIKALSKRRHWRNEGVVFQHGPSWSLDLRMQIQGRRPQQTTLQMRIASRWTLSRSECTNRKLSGACFSAKIGLT